MIKLLYKYKIRAVSVKPKDFMAMGFNRFVEKRAIHNQFAEFKKSAKSMHVSQKRRTNAAAMREFIDLYNVDEYYCEYHDQGDYRDDSFEVWYTVKAA
jgi:hypothetical protein